jgi:hypothetical protein
VNYILQFLKVATLASLLTGSLSAEVGQAIPLDATPSLSNKEIKAANKFNVPEPGVFALIGTAGLLLMFRRRSR